jgi:hypothetical protein
MNQLNLTFKHMLDAAATGCTLRIQSSANGVTWTNEAWSVASTSSNVGPATVNTTVLNNLNSPTTYVAFTIEGNLYRYDYWYVDNVTITGNIPTIRDLTNLNVTLTQCIDAMQTINVAGNGTYVTVQPSGSATLIAGQNIFMHPGTLVMPGGSLHAYIAPTGPYCPPPAKESIAAVSETQFAPATSFFRIYPNPTTGEFTLALNGLVPFEPVSVIVYDMQGKKIGSAVMTNQIKHSFSLAGYPSGLYLVVVNTGYQFGSSRIVKAE